jgi:hypothetical protein
MTDTQRNALKIVIEAVVNGASNGYTIKVDDIVTVIEGIIEKEKETQFVPGVYPNNIKYPNLPIGDTPPFKDYPGIENPKLWDQIVYTYNTTNTTSTADVNSGENQMICETKQL